jgi:HAD superfamily hydrolase (TIGR01509 family)
MCTYSNLIMVSRLRAQIERCDDLKICALLFDMDGTLTNSEPAWFAACNETLIHYGKNKIEKEIYERDFVGTTVMKNIVKMFPEFSPTELKKAEAMYKDEFEKRLGQVLIKEYVIDVLELVDRKKLKCGLVTNTPRGIVNKVLIKFGIEKYFQVFVCEGDTARAKPFPDPVIKGCELLSVVPNETIYVEDSVTGVMAGKASGCFTIAVTAGMKIDLLKEAGADLVLDNIGQLLEIIENV